MAEGINFLAVQDYFGLPEFEPVKKDWHILHAMQAITRLDTAPFRLVFAGGTALARAHQCVQRMSEDVDFKIVAPKDLTLSNAQRRKRLGELRDQITASLLEAGFVFDPNDSACLRSRDANQYTLYNLPYQDETEHAGHLRPRIQIELTFTTLRLPPVVRPVASFVAQAYGRPPEVPAIECVSLTETAAEKLVGLTRRRAMELAGESRNPDPTLVRHIHDLHAIRAHIDRPQMVSLAQAISQQDAQEFKHQYPAYLDDIQGETWKALADWQSQASKALYENFIRAMVYADASPFEEAIATVNELAALVWPRA